MRDTRQGCGVMPQPCPDLAGFAVLEVCRTQLGGTPAHTPLAAPSSYCCTCCVPFLSLTGQGAACGFSGTKREAVLALQKLAKVPPGELGLLLAEAPLILMLVRVPGLVVRLAPSLTATRSTGCIFLSVLRPMSAAVTAPPAA